MKASELIEEIAMSDVFEDFAKETTKELDKVEGLNLAIEEMIVKAYAGWRLKPLIGHLDISEKRYNNIVELIIEKYLEEDYSLDLIINAVYNYINSNKHSPSDRLLTDDIEALLQDYAEE